MFKQKKSPDNKGQMQS